MWQRRGWGGDVPAPRRPRPRPVPPPPSLSTGPHVTFIPIPPPPPLHSLPLPSFPIPDINDFDREVPGPDYTTLDPVFAARDRELAAAGCRL